MMWRGSLPSCFRTALLKTTRRIIDEYYTYQVNDTTTNSVSGVKNPGRCIL